MKPYITHNNILVTDSTLDYFKSVVFSVPYNGVPSLRRPFYRNIAVFLQHVICVATCSRKNRKKAKIKANKNGLILCQYHLSWVGINFPEYLRKVGQPMNVQWRHWQARELSS